MYVEPHGPDTMDTYSTIAGLVETRKLPCFATMVDDAYPAWHTICIFEEEMLTVQRQNPTADVLADWLMVVGQVNAEGRSGPIEDVPEYVGWTCGGLPVQAWLQHGDTCVVIGRESCVHLLPLADFEEKFEPLVLVEAELADDSAIGMNAAFALISTIDATQQAVVLESLEKLWGAS